MPLMTSIEAENINHYLNDFNLSVNNSHDLESRLKQKQQYLMKENIKGFFDSESIVAPILTNIQN